MGIMLPSSPGNIQADGIRKSPIGELHFFIVYFIRITW
jgi:hypothetical protein